MRGAWVVLGCLTGCVAPDALVDRLLDADGDGFRTTVAGGTDCDDGRDDVSPAAVERCANGRDDDCDGEVDEDGEGAVPVWPDRDGDGFGDAQSASHLACAAGPAESTVGGDCADADEAVHPDATETCDGIDEDCDGEVDEGLPRPIWYPDRDRDGYGRPGDAVRSCVRPDGHVGNALDCDDRRQTVFPGAPDVPYDDLDADCAGDDDRDADGDGLRPEPWGPDCDDTRGDVYPGAPEVPYDGVDANCDPADDNDADGDGFPSQLLGGTDCDDARDDVYPGAQDLPYDGLDADCAGDDDFDADGDGLRGGPFDQDCDDDDARVTGPVLWFVDEDVDTWGDSQQTALACTRPVGSWSARGGDCDDDDPFAYPGGPEAVRGCDGADNDCDGRVDEDQGVLWYLDFDDDGRGDPAVVSAPTCQPPVGRWVDNAWDCDDDDPDTYLGAPLRCREGDEDCDPTTPSAPPSCPGDLSITP